MSDDDLGKRVTRCPGFEWKPGMISSDSGLLLWEIVNGFSPASAWRTVLGGSLRECAPERLALSHLSNTGFLLDLLSSIHDDAYANCVEVGFLSDEDGKYRESVAHEEGETVNHALARAILAAVERAS